MNNIKSKSASRVAFKKIKQGVSNLTYGRGEFLGLPKRFWFRIVLLSPFAFMLYLAILIGAYTFMNPGLTTFMTRDLYYGQEITQRWVPLRRISRHMLVAVIVSEDSRFCEHGGVDWDAIQRVLDSDRKNAGGASTITMQTVKNLFLWPDRSYLRKGIEIGLAQVVDLAWSKRRQMEIYLNIAEFGPGVYGVEAAARYHFQKSASQLTRYEASLLTAVLPDPHGRKAWRPGSQTRGIAGRILRRMKAGGQYARCVL